MGINREENHAAEGLADAQYNQESYPDSYLELMAQAYRDSSLEEMEEVNLDVYLETLAKEDPDLPLVLQLAA